MARTEEDFEKGKADGTSDAPAVIRDPLKPGFTMNSF
jgi:hypothetical protein